VQRKKSEKSSYGYSPVLPQCDFQFLRRIKEKLFFGRRTGMRSILDILDLSTDEIKELIDTALDIIDHPAKYAEICRGKKLATLFFEPSTRTRLSFEAAMYELGGNVIGFSAANNSSAAKARPNAKTGKILFFQDFCKSLSSLSAAIAPKHT
jgi:ornithine carbamoyltransferase